jgi:hypothetical protein
MVNRAPMSFFCHDADHSYRSAMPSVSMAPRTRVTAADPHPLRACPAVPLLLARPNPLAPRTTLLASSFRRVLRVSWPLSVLSVSSSNLICSPRALRVIQMVLRMDQLSTLFSNSQLIGIRLTLDTTSPPPVLTTCTFSPSPADELGLTVFLISHIPTCLFAFDYSS